MKWMPNLWPHWLEEWVNITKAVSSPISIFIVSDVYITPMNHSHSGPPWNYAPHSVQKVTPTYSPDVNATQNIKIFRNNIFEISSAPWNASHPTTGTRYKTTWNLNKNCSNSQCKRIIDVYQVYYSSRITTTTTTTTTPRLPQPPRLPPPLLPPIPPQLPPPLPPPLPLPQ